MQRPSAGAHCQRRRHLFFPAVNRRYAKASLLRGTSRVSEPSSYSQMVTEALPGVASRGLQNR